MSKLKIEIQSNEVIKNGEFISILKRNLLQFSIQRNNRPSPSPGLYYRRDWFDRMTDLRLFHSSYFLNNIESIWLKKSLLSSEHRKVIKYFCENALNEMLLNQQKNK